MSFSFKLWLGESKDAMQWICKPVWSKPRRLHGWMDNDDAFTHETTQMDAAGFLRWLLLMQNKHRIRVQGPALLDTVLNNADDARILIDMLCGIKVSN